MSIPVVLLGLPARPGGLVSQGSAIASFLHPAMKASVHWRVVNGSVLTFNFNTTWTIALNERANLGLTHFAMLHEDVCPEDFWLDKLLDELRKSDADVVSAVVPIKTSEGTTSTALETPDPWRPNRLSMREVFERPETWTEDGLLINTGCWIARLDRPWCEQICFRNQDRIVNRDGKFVPEFMPEDWDFSRQLRNLGAKVCATRAVRLYHEREEWNNFTPWGAEVPHPEEPGNVVFPDDVPGWLTREEGLALANLARGKRVLEIGSYCGKSTVCLAQTADLVVAVDPFDGRGTPTPLGTRESFERATQRYGVRDKIRVVVGTGADLTPEDGPFDLAFIDGAHDYASVQADVGYAVARLAPGGLLAFHDYREHHGEFDGGWDAGVTQSVLELVSGGAQMLARHGSLAVVRPAGGS